jgi:hypothetical protein
LYPQFSIAKSPLNNTSSFSESNLKSIYRQIHSKQPHLLCDFWCIKNSIIHPSFACWLFHVRLVTYNSSGLNHLDPCYVCEYFFQTWLYSNSRVFLLFRFTCQLPVASLRLLARMLPRHLPEVSTNYR